MFAAEPITSVWDEALPLAAAHWAEVGWKLPLKMDRAAYAKAEAEQWHCFHTARINGKLVGYVSTVLRHNVHDGALEAIEEGIYVLPEYRGFLGTDLERFADSVLAQCGVQRSLRERVITDEMRVDADRSMRRGPIGYRPVGIVWAKDLKAVSHG